MRCLDVRIVKASKLFHVKHKNHENRNKLDVLKARLAAWG